MEVCLLDSLRGVLQKTPPLWSFDVARTRCEPNQPLFSFSELHLRVFISPSSRPPAFVLPTHTNRCRATGPSRRKL